MLILFISLLVLSFFLFLLSFRFFYKKKKLIKQCTESVIGEIKGSGSFGEMRTFGAAEITIDGGPSPYAYYVVDGKEYKVKYTMQVYKSSFLGKVIVKNDVSSRKINIKYDKNNPKLAYIEGDDLSGCLFLGYMFLISGILFTFISFLCLVIK